MEDILMCSTMKTQSIFIDNDDVFYNEDNVPGLLYNLHHVYQEHQEHIERSKFEDLHRVHRMVLDPDRDGYKGNKIQFSGPLVSSNVDQMLKDHDHVYVTAQHN
ncbi:uncharacterized protein LOC118492337 [Helianthus annuus]|uniref:uncharacterized protein LOC118492337 n=1 Tax=Helianthus annuus TaxID=4232 RepID=UPI0016533176|nr:uncharacterized protein LOC118492337 [Helianthus annuus]